MKKAVAVALAVLGGCATPTYDRPEVQRPELRRVLRGPALIAALVPVRLPDRNGWVEDIHAAMAALKVQPTPENVCAVIAIIDQESNFRVDPAIPGLGALARRELERRRERAGIPKVVVDSALALPSSDGRSYNARLEAATTERQLSDLFEDFAGRVPLAKTLFMEHNPVRTAGPMQVSIAFAELHAAAKRYPFRLTASVRDEVFTRRGGLYFGIAHLLDYAAPYDDMHYRFADFNAGRFASRNAAFQKAVSDLVGAPLELDGDLLRYENGRPVREVSRTEALTRGLAVHFEMTAEDVRRDLELAQSAEFEKSRLYLSVFTLIDGVTGARAPRAVVPAIVVDSFKTTRRLTTANYAARVSERYKGCLAQL